MARLENLDSDSPHSGVFPEAKSSKKDDKTMLALEKKSKNLVLVMQNKSDNHLHKRDRINSPDMYYILPKYDKKYISYQD
jgi:hypothetical protein